MKKPASLLPQVPSVSDFFKMPEIGELLAPPKLELKTHTSPAKPSALRRAANPHSLYTDTLERPDHYTEAQRVIAKTLHGGGECSERELIDLLIAFYRPTELRKATVQAVRKATRPGMPPKSLPPVTPPLKRDPALKVLEQDNPLSAATGPIIKLA